MYTLIHLLLLGSGIGLLIHGVTRRGWGEIALGGVVVLTGFFFMGLLQFWAEMLWFQAIGFPQRFWTVVLARLGFAGLGALLGGVTVFLLTWRIPKSAGFARIWPECAGAFFGGLYGFAAWADILKFMNRVSVGVADPILQKDAGFYLFVLPLLDTVHRGFFTLSCIAVMACLAGAFLQFGNAGNLVEIRGLMFGREDFSARLRPVFPALASALVFYAFGQYLNRFHLMYSTRGVVAGAGWTDVHVLLPAYLTVAILAVVCAVVIAVPACRRAVGRIARFTGEGIATVVAGIFVPLGVLALAWFLGVAVIPQLCQWLYVEPNEITVERPYIEHNIALTRAAFGIDDIKESEFPVSEEFTKQTVAESRDVLDEIRLWDWRALAQVYEQFQEIRLYYQFADVDIDRYRLGDSYRQVMVSAREMRQENLPEQSKTFVNLRFKYTHGFGLTMAPVSEFTQEGLPQLLIKDIPPKSTHEELEVTRPEVYYGELTNSHVVVNSSEREFDYPSGDQNKYTSYKGTGGVLLSNLWRKFVFGARFDGTRFFMSSYPTTESRVQFYRNVRERVKRVAPFLIFEDDPYIVLHKGRMYWIVDAYTASNRFPYSEPYYGWEKTGQRNRVTGRRVSERAAPHFSGSNYVRNSVKAVVDAYNGDVKLYVFEPRDPLIQVWQNIFPGLFTPTDEMPEGLRRHVRYPASYLLMQGLVYAKYHMTDPAVFYNQEDLWVRATEKYYNNVQAVDPYYVMWRPPDSQAAEFVLFMPFTPKNKQVMIGWIAGMCDGESYGDLLAYKFPKEKRVLGTQQVETKIDQDSYLSGRLSLWDQRGSRVIRGNMLAIPIQDTLLYVEPIYLKAETAAYPELRLIAVMHDDKLSYAETFDEALQGLFGEEKPISPPVGPRTSPAAGEEARKTLTELAQEANTAFENYLRLQNERRFDQASREIERLQKLLEEMAGRDNEEQ